MFIYEKQTRNGWAVIFYKWKNDKRKENIVFLLNKTRLREMSIIKVDCLVILDKKRLSTSKISS